MKANAAVLTATVAFAEATTMDDAASAASVIAAPAFTAELTTRFVLPDMPARPKMIHATFQAQRRFAAGVQQRAARLGLLGGLVVGTVSFPLRRELAPAPVAAAEAAWPSAPAAPARNVFVVCTVCTGVAALLRATVRLDGYPSGIGPQAVSHSG